MLRIAILTDLPADKQGCLPIFGHPTRGKPVFPE
jgi:hypothetical protein